jgi:hypothetical protein
LYLRVIETANEALLAASDGPGGDVKDLALCVIKTTLGKLFVGQVYFQPLRYKPEVITNQVKLNQRKKGNYEEAQKHFEVSYQKRSLLLGDDAPLALNSMNDLVEVYYLQGNFAIATELCLKCLEKRMVRVRVCVSSFSV